MAMYVKTEYEGFVCTVTVTSDTIDAIDLSSPDFRIDFIDQFTAAGAAQQIAGLMEDKDGAEKARDARNDITIDAAMCPDAAEAYPGQYSYAELTSAHDCQIQKLHYAKQAEIAKLNAIVSGLAYTMNEANSAVDACEHGTAGTSGQAAHKGIQDYIAEINRPMLSIVNNATELYETSAAGFPMFKAETFANTTDELLIAHGMQFWVSKDKKSMTFRFTPQPSAQCKFQAFVAIVAFDAQNTTRFEVCLMPRLMTGELMKADAGKSNYGIAYPTDDPFVPQHEWTSTAKTPDGEMTTDEHYDDHRPDYQFNDESDVDHFYANNTSYTETSLETPEHSATKIVPLYVLKTSAFLTDDIAKSGYTYNWGKFKSELYDVAGLSAMPIPFDINGATAIGDIAPKTVSETLVSSYTGTDTTISAMNTIEMNLYEITQYVETSAEVPQFSQNQLRVTVAI